MICIPGIIEETAWSCLGCKRPWVRIPPSRLLESIIYGHLIGARFSCDIYSQTYSVQYFPFSSSFPNLHTNMRDTNRSAAIEFKPLSLTVKEEKQELLLIEQFVWP